MQVKKETIFENRSIYAFINIILLGIVLITYLYSVINFFTRSDNARSGMEFFMYIPQYVAFILVVFSFEFARLGFKYRNSKKIITSSFLSFFAIIFIFINNDILSTLAQNKQNLSFLNIIEIISLSLTTIFGFLGQIQQNKTNKNN